MSILKIIERAQKTREKKARNQVLAGMALGAILGVAAGILLAPKSGKETREELANAAKQVPDKAREFAELNKAKFDEVKAKLREAQASAKAEVAASQEPSNS